jgi:tRNA(Arg) A34 adenosine deaminase TadA/SAM-dependent methyltransferase
MAVDYFSSRHPLRALASKVSLRARRRMYAVFERRIKPTKDCRVLDVGITPDQTLPESNFFEALYPHKENITATSFEAASQIERRFPGVRFVRTSGSRLPFPDGSFDIVVSFAVLEHVGTREDQRRFLSELFRVGNRVFLTTPNRWFPVEFHTFLPFLHWLPQRAHQALLRRLNMKFWADTANLNLLGASDLRGLMPANSEVDVSSIKLLGLPSNLIACGIARRPGPPMLTDTEHMRCAMALAADAAHAGDVPIGAVLVVARRTFYARNEKELRPDPTAHAEVLAIRSAAAALGTWRLAGATLYVTKEPCAMCAGAIVAARIERVVFGCRDPKGGAAGSAIDVFASEAVNHRPLVVAGVLEGETAAQLRRFFQSRRQGGRAEDRAGTAS